MSPVHNSYEKSNVQLATAEHRCQMVRLSLLSSDWIRLSNWEAQQSRWSRTREVLQYHQVRIFSFYFFDYGCKYRLKRQFIELHQFHAE